MDAFKGQSECENHFATVMNPMAQMSGTIVLHVIAGMGNLTYILCIYRFDLFIFLKCSLEYVRCKLPIPQLNLFFFQSWFD